MGKLRARLPKSMRRIFPKKPGGIVVFAPNAWFPSMISAPAIIARTLAERGYTIDVISCAANRETCTVMDGVAPLEQRPARRFCKDCVVRSRDYLAQYGLEQWWDTDFFTREDQNLFEELRITIGPDPRLFSWEGIEIGTLAAGNLSAIMKRDVFTDLSDELRDRLHLMVEDGLRWMIIAKRIFARLQPRHLVYYAEYYSEVIVGLAMQRLGVHVAPVTHSTLCGNDFRKIQVLDQMPQVLDMARRLPSWPKWRELSLTPEQVRDVCDDVLVRLLGKSVQSFSPALNQGDELSKLVSKLRPNLKTLVAFTSSDDEINNTKRQRLLFGVPANTSGDIFVDQTTWLREVADFVSKSPSHQLIVRLHPRLAANVRSASVADYQSQVDAVASLACDRIHVVMPDSKCSSYDIAQHADLVLTAWSSIGLECVRIGLPVIMAFQGLDIYPAGDFLNYTSNRVEYFRLLNDGVKISVEDVLQAYRFTHMFLCSIALDFSDLTAMQEDPTLPLFKMPVCAGEVEDFVLGRDVIQNRRLKEQQAVQDRRASQRERTALAASIRRTILALTFGAEEEATTQLSLHAQNTTTYRNLSVERTDGALNIRYEHLHVVRSSKSIGRLALFLNELEESNRFVEG